MARARVRINQEKLAGLCTEAGVPVNRDRISTFESGSAQPTWPEVVVMAEVMQLKPHVLVLFAEDAAETVATLKARDAAQAELEASEAAGAVDDAPTYEEPTR
jgi:hypothetical protein